MNDNNRDIEELIELFAQLKQHLKQEMEEKEKLLKQIEIYEQNKALFNQHLDQMKLQYEEQNDVMQKSLNQINALKEDNCQLKASLLNMNSLFREKEEMHNNFVEKTKHEFNTELNELKNKLETNEADMKRLNDCIYEKDITIRELEMNLNENKSNNDIEMNRIENSYESKIETLNNEWKQKYNKCLELNNEKIIEVKANCLMTIQKTKEEYESQLISVKNQNQDLTERYSELRLECEARKMPTFFANPNKSNTSNSIVKNNSKNVAKATPNRPLTNQKVSIQILDSNNGQNGQTVQLIAPKRKKLIQNTDSYLEFLKDNV